MASELITTEYGLISSKLKSEKLAGLCVPKMGVQTGPFGSQLHKEDYVEVGTPIITVEHLGENRIRHTDTPYVSDHDKDRLSKYSLKEGDIVFSRVGSVDRRSLVRKAENGWLFSGRCLRVRVDKNKIDPSFLSYFFGYEGFKNYIKGIAVGATMPSINTKILSEIRIFYPPLEEQKAIAHTLGSLDDKIELNRQMNETLEAMAQALFKSWFVDFDPVIDNALAAGNLIPDEFAERAEQRKGIEKKNNSDIQGLFPDEFEFTEKMGWIPKGWLVSSVGTEFNTVGGGTPSTKNPDFWENGDISWTTPKDLSGNQSKVLLHTDRKITESGLNKISSGLLPIDTVLMSSRAPVGYLALAKVPVAINQGYIALKCEKTLTPEFAIQWADSAMDEIKQRAGGTTFAEISKTNFRGISVLAPSQKIIDIYSRDVKDLYNQITSRIENIDTLAKLRDTLLPKLMSGELRIPDAAALVDEVL